jgi:hypothetical protein
MSKISDVRNVTIEKARVLFDTTIWILINGFGANASPERVTLYSNAYKALLLRENKIVVNDYVIGEFYNRCAKMEYQIIKEEAERYEYPVANFKAYRQTSSFAPILQSIRDTCLNIVDDCEYIPIDGGHFDIRTILNECCSECADFSDRVLIGFCKKENLCVMTDDADFANCGLNILTGNKKIKSRAVH